MLELPNFGHAFILTRPGVVNFVEIIKIAIKLIKTNLTLN